MPPVKRVPKKRLEKDILTDIREYLASRNDVKIMRNAQAYVEFPDGHRARCGLGVGSPDLVGSLTLIKDGMAIAVALGIEVKRPGEKPSTEQKAWVRVMEGMGWVVGVATSVDESKLLVDKAKERLEKLCGIRQ